MPLHQRSRQHRLRSAGGARAFDTRPPHDGYPQQACYDTLLTAGSFNSSNATSAYEDSSGSSSSSDGRAPLFCDDFEAPAADAVPYGLSANFQRNQSNYQRVRPWNSSFIRTWNDAVVYADAYQGSGYAVNVPQTVSSLYNASITSRWFALQDQQQLEQQLEQQQWQCSELLIRYAYIMVADSPGAGGSLRVEMQLMAAEFEQLAVYEDSSTRQLLDGTVMWQEEQLTVALPALQERRTMQTAADTAGVEGEINAARLRFTCSAGLSASSFCALDELYVYCSS